MTSATTQALPTLNAFCPTGEGGGIKNDCGSGFKPDSYTMGDLLGGKLVGKRLKNLVHPENPRRDSLLKTVASLWSNDDLNPKLRKMVSEMASMTTGNGTLAAYHPGAGTYFRGGESKGVRATAASFSRDKHYAKGFGKLSSVEIDSSVPAIDLDKLNGGGSVFKEVLIDLRKVKSGKPTTNAVKKGWSAAARLKSALVRKAKKKPTPLKKVSPNSPEYKKLKAGDKEKVLNNALKQFDKQGSAYRSVKTKGYKNLLDVRVEANKSIGRFEGMARAYRKRAEGLKGKKRRIYLHMALNCLQQATQLSSDVMKRKRPVTTNMIKTLLILNSFQESTNNAKKGSSKGTGWSAKARIAAALARKKKTGTKSGESKPVKKSPSKSDPYAGGPTWKNGKPTYGKAGEPKPVKNKPYDPKAVARIAKQYDRDIKASKKREDAVSKAIEMGNKAAEARYKMTQSAIHKSAGGKKSTEYKGVRYINTQGTWIPKPKKRKNKLDWQS